MTRAPLRPATMSSDSKSFEDNWTFPNELKTQLGAASYDIRPLLETFRSGRPKFEALFLDRTGTVLSRRIAMELVSKKSGKPYHVVSMRDANEPQLSAPPRVILRSAARTQSQALTLADVLSHSC